MIGPQRIDQLSREEKRKIQRDLIRLGFLDETLPSGDPADDGIWGPVTIRAYEAYWKSRPVSIAVPIIAPAPVRPWWLSRGVWGSLLTLVAVGAGFAGMGFDAEAATDAVMPIVETIPLLLAGIGAVLSWWGRRNAKAPIDKTLVARIGGRDIRIDRMRRQPLPTRRDSEYGTLFGDDAQ